MNLNFEFVEGKKVFVPIYNFVTHRRESKTVSMYGATVIIFEGILAFHNKDVLDMLDMKVRSMHYYFNVIISNNMAFKRCLSTLILMSVWAAVWTET